MYTCIVVSIVAQTNTNCKYFQQKNIFSGYLYPNYAKHDATRPGACQTCVKQRSYDPHDLIRVFTFITCEHQILYSRSYRIFGRRAARRRGSRSISHLAIFTPFIHHPIPNIQERKAGHTKPKQGNNQTISNKRKAVTTCPIDWTEFFEVFEGIVTQHNNETLNFIKEISKKVEKQA